MESHALHAPVAPIAPVFEEIDIPVWAWALVALAAVVSYFVMLENGAVLSDAAGTLHEFFHDGRHFSGRSLPLTSEGRRMRSPRQSR